MYIRISLKYNEPSVAINDIKKINCINNLLFFIERTILLLSLPALIPFDIFNFITKSFNPEGPDKLYCELCVRHIPADWPAYIINLPDSLFIRCFSLMGSGI